jgi:hypothetical protein
MLSSCTSEKNDDARQRPYLFHTKDMKHNKDAETIITLLKELFFQIQPAIQIQPVQFLGFFILN